ncbi:MAG: hypothetical protein RJA52_1535 [Bacteroidota bacterium]
MDNKLNAWCEDILRSIEEIYMFLPNKRDFFQFQKDIKTKKAIERNLEIIGEAAKRISAVTSLQNSREIIGTRNRLAHDYQNISDEVIWTIINRELPKLKEEIKNLIDPNYMA